MLTPIDVLPAATAAHPPVRLVRAAWLHAHRGASADAPENTLAAFRLAIVQGAPGIELDVHVTADDVPVVIHDPSLDRTTDRSGLVRHLPASTVTGADTLVCWARHRVGAAPSRDRAAWTAEATRVPALATVLAWLPPERGLVIDVKDPAAVPGIVRLLADRPAASRTVRLISFQPAAIEMAREMAPWLPTGLLLEPGESVTAGMAAAAEGGHASVVPWEADLGDAGTARWRVKDARARGITVGCYVVNDLLRAQVLRAAGVAFLMSDRPVELVSLEPRSAPR